MPQTVHNVPAAEIDAASLTRDRLNVDPEALEELRESILRSGLRMPIEVYAFPEARGDHRYGLLSGFRRLAAYRELGKYHDGYDTIPAFLRTPADRAEAMAAMVEENTVRADISPWEQARVAVHATDRGIYDTQDAAIEHLFPHANPTKRSRLRAVAQVIDVLEYIMKEPERLSERQLLRVSNALRNGFAEPIETAVRQTSTHDHDTQWAAILPYLVESERFSAPDEPEPVTRASARRGRPRRVLKPRQHLVIRREMARDGYILRFTGKEATSSLLDEVLDEIERWFSPG